MGRCCVVFLNFRSRFLRENLPAYLILYYFPIVLFGRTRALHCQDIHNDNNHGYAEGKNKTVLKTHHTCIYLVDDATFQNLRELRQSINQYYPYCFWRERKLLQLVAKYIIALSARVSSCRMYISTHHLRLISPHQQKKTLLVSVDFLALLLGVRYDPRRLNRHPPPYSQHRTPTCRTPRRPRTSYRRHLRRFRPRRLHAAPP
jgi:hypothetical protein